jgi:metallo-beta-lactamase family protein
MQGFKGEIIATAATFELAKLVLKDTARLQEEDAARAKRRARKGMRGGREDAEALYGPEDLEALFVRFGRAAEYGKALELSQDLRITFRDAGHILGSASLLVEAQEKGHGRRIVFSGDLGSPMHPVVRDPEPCPQADFVVMESTYGGRRHRTMLETSVEFFGAIRNTLDQGGNVVIPTFALERAQEILYGLREGLEHGILPSSMKVFVDSPLAGSATEVFRRHPECFDDHARAVLQRIADPFAFPGLSFTRDREESKAINSLRGGAVILAGAGMCTGGRVLHHLHHLLPRSECAVVFVGFAAAGTPARAIIEGAKTVRILGDEIPVRARIHTINGFSGHADHKVLTGWLASSGNPENVFLVHGDPEALQALRVDLETSGKKVCVPALHQGYDL